MNRSPRRILTGSLIGCLLLAGCASVPDDATLASAITAASGSVGRVIVARCDGAPNAGSAVWLGDGLVLTAAHVVENGRTVSVRFPGHSPVLAEAVGEDDTRDLVLLKASGAVTAPGLAPATSAATRGQSLGLLGYPIAGDGVATQQARVSDTASVVSFRGVDQSFLRLDAESAGGNSGGAVIDAQGRLQGLMVAVVNSLRPSEGSRVVTLAVPAADLAERIERWKLTPTRTSVGAACADESARQDAPPLLSVTSSDPIAAEVSQTIWLALAGWNAGQRTSAGHQFTATGRTQFARTEEGLARRTLAVTVVSRSGDHVEAALTTTVGDAGHCRSQEWRYQLTEVSGTWLIDRVAAVGSATGC